MPNRVISTTITLFNVSDSVSRIQEVNKGIENLGVYIIKLG